MAIITYPLNNIEYTAEDAELYLSTRTSGVFAGDDFSITVPGNGNIVTIGEGIGWIRNSKFAGKVVANKTEMSLDLGLPHATYPRIDAIVLQFSANSNASDIIVKNGTAQTSPTPPEVVRTESVYELHLYHVYRPAGAASVTASNVTDLRLNESYCGLMRDGVTGIPTDQLQSQVDALLDQLRENIEQTENGQILDGSVTEPKLANNSVSTRALVDLSVTPSKISNDGIPIGKGGTGATTADAARSNLGAAAASHTHAAGNITSGTLNAARLPTVPIAKGGTGATSAATALSNLGAMAASRLVAVYNASVAFTNGIATYTNPSITTGSVVFVERRVGSAGGSNVHAFGTTSNSGSVTICASATFSASVNLNILIINP